MVETLPDLDEQLKFRSGEARNENCMLNSPLWR